MSLEQFKTQILLLHSEQDTLDSLSTGFNDRYTVHCATSGSEALNTLGETEIDVLVTAQDLPGMSGLDALREAKKRSPDTIGILLAGNDGEGVEALVGAQEVFQVVRGGVTPDSLRGVIESATRQDRLMALAESANDTTAAMDEPSEHIVMETSENGSAIISDGTGRMPVLNPDKVSADANVGSRAVDVLVLTKDEEFLTTVRESARGMHNIIYANTLAQADDAVRKQKVGVAVVDAAMVGDNVEKLTVHLRTASPRLVAIVAGRRDDGEMLMDLINRGKVYRFLLKPVSPGRARLAIEASVKHHLEAPDAAFRTVGSPAAPTAVPKAAPKATPKAAKAQPKPAQKAPAPAAAKPTQKPAQKSAPPAPAPEQSMSVPTIKVEPRPVPIDSTSLMDDALGEAFGGDDKSFTETMTGIVRSVGETISTVTGRNSDSAAEPEPAAPARMQVDLSFSGGSIFGNPKIIGMGAAAAVVLLGFGWWLFSGSDETTAIEEPLAGTPLETEAPPVFEAPAPEPTRSGVDELIEDARLAADAGQVFNPPGSNAIELYMAAAEAAPGNDTVTTEMAVVIEQALGMAESSLLDRRAGDASAALQRVAMADPTNARLPFLNAQLAQMQLRDFLDSSRLAIREGNYEDAAIALDRARALGLDDSGEITVVADELSAALSEQRVDDVLAKANARLDEGKLTAPSNDNARYYFELALSNDPGNSAARQGLNVIASKLVLQARAEIDASQFDAAEILLADARRLDPSSSDLAATTTALAAARDRQVQELRAAEQRAADERAAAARAEAERLAAERAAVEQAAAEKLAAERLAAEKLAAEQLAAENLAAEQLAAERLAAERLAAEQLAAERLAAEQLAADRLAAERLAAEKLAAEKLASQQAAANTTAPAAAQSRIVVSKEPVAASSLQRTKYVAPKYPRSAQRRNQTGWVDVVFTVDIDGTVKDISIRDSNPGITFVNSAVSAVEDWEFAPVIENGAAIQKRAAVRMMFAIE